MAEQSPATSTTQPKDIEDQLPSPFSDDKVCLVFIRKLYTILCAQLMVIIGIVGLFFIKSVKEWTVSMDFWVFYVALAIQLVTLIAMTCCPIVRRRFPQNYIFLTMFTLAEGVTLGLATAAYGKEVIMAIVVCAAITWALTAFTLQTKFDYTHCRGTLLSMVMALIMFGIFCAVFRGEENQVVNNCCACLGALIFSFYIVWDTQLMILGKHKYALGPEEYVFAALNLYLDIVIFFMEVLIANMCKSSDKKKEKSDKKNEKSDKKEAKSELTVPEKVDES